MNRALALSNRSLLATQATVFLFLVFPVTGAAQQVLNSNLRFFPLTPCRVIDTRSSVPINPGSPIVVSSFTACGVPSNAKAYAINVTAIPTAAGDVALSVGPGGGGSIVVVNSDGRIVANNSVMPAAADLSLRLSTTRQTHAVIDINGYFADQPGGGVFHGITPCRVADTRNSPGTFGGPSIGGNTSRSFPIPQSACGVPSNATAFVLNFTAVPPGYLAYITVWPTGQLQPLVSTLNAMEGTVVANGAIIPSGNNGAISVYALNTTDLVIDVSGYFSNDDGTGWYLNTVNPCVAVASVALGGGGTGTYDLKTPCFASSSATPLAFAMNATATPSSVPPRMDFMTVWPAGQTQPYTSLMNSMDGRRVSNGGIIQSGSSGGIWNAISTYVTNPASVELDVTGFFAVQQQGGGGTVYLTTSASGGGTISPGSGWYTAGTTVQVTASPNQGYQFTGFGGALTGTVNPQYLTLNTSTSVTASFAAQILTHTITSFPPGLNLTIDGVACTSPCTRQWSPGSSHTIATTTPQPKGSIWYTFGAWSDRGALSHTVTALSTPTSYVAAFVPQKWNGINYSPRGHSYFRMLYDWNNYNLSSTVNADLAKLSEAGFNVVHLYVWDRDSVGADPSGFVGVPGDPAQSSNSQWAALNEFVGLAENNGLYVVVTFVSGATNARWSSLPPTPRRADVDNIIVNPYKTWMSSFMQYLCGTMRHQNILAWSSYWTLLPSAGQTNIEDSEGFNSYSYAFAKLYKGMDDAARSVSPAPGVLGLIGTAQIQDFGLLDTNGNKVAKMITRGGGYRFNWEIAQSLASTAREVLSHRDIYNTTKDPDLYVFGLYHANAEDFRQALTQLTTAVGFPIPASKIFANEWATASGLGPDANGVPFYGSVGDASTGNGYPSYGDNNDPVLTVQGQLDWVRNTLCSFRAAGVDKAAYWALYDPYTVFSTPPWSKGGQELAWWGYWGLAYESQLRGDKPAWSLMRDYYRNGTLNCPSGGVVNASPILTLTPISQYYTVAQPVRVTWTASDISAVSSPGASGTLACDTEETLSTTLQAASCASTDAPGAASTGNYTVSLTATGSNGSPSNTVTASKSVTIGLGPVLSSVTNSAYSTTIHANDVMVMWGMGFANEPTNMLVFTRSGYPDVWYPDWQGVGILYQSNTQINISLAGRLAPGTWNLQVWNGYSGTPSSTYQVTIVP